MRRKMEWNGFKITVLIAGIAVGLICLILAGILVDEYLLVYEKDAMLTVEETYFEKDQRVGEQIELNVFVMVTNDGDRDCDSHIRAFIIDRDTNIAMDDTTTEEVNIRGRSTHEASFELLVPEDASYRVEILVFKDDMITVKGVGHVDLAVGGTGGQDYRTTMEDEEVEGEKLSTPFLGPAAITAVLCVSVLLFRRLRR